MDPITAMLASLGMQGIGAGADLLGIPGAKGGAQAGTSDMFGMFGNLLGSYVLPSIFGSSEDKMSEVANQAVDKLADTQKSLTRELTWSPAGYTGDSARQQAQQRLGSFGPTGMNMLDYNQGRGVASNLMSSASSQAGQAFKMGRDSLGRQNNAMMGLARQTGTPAAIAGAANAMGSQNSQVMNQMFGQAQQGYGNAMAAGGEQLGRTQQGYTGALSEGFKQRVLPYMVQQPDINMGPYAGIYGGAQANQLSAAQLNRSMNTQGASEALYGQKAADTSQLDTWEKWFEKKHKGTGEPGWDTGINGSKLGKIPQRTYDWDAIMKKQGIIP